MYASNDGIFGTNEFMFKIYIFEWILIWYRIMWNLLHEGYSTCAFVYIIVYVCMYGFYSITAAFGSIWIEADVIWGVAPSYVEKWCNHIYLG